MLVERSSRLKKLLKPNQRVLLSQKSPSQDLIFALD
uniref:Uncharacterized protein MANES_15G055300 n=1 Tax=Rhizophora mucronata TaxID=61149 RepID=A0A2P2NKE1_RHIMU